MNKTESNLSNGFDVLASDLGRPQRDTSRADAVFSGAQILLNDLGWSCLMETPLANKRRADILAINRKGEFLIVEVKSCLTDFTSDAKWEEYADYCDYFCFAVDESFPQGRLPDETGLIVADAFGGAVIRDFALDKLNGARRKAVTLNFARLAASRLYRNLTSSVV